MPVAVTSAGANTTPANLGVATAKSSTGTYTITPDIRSYEDLICFPMAHKGTGCHMAQVKSKTHGVVTIETRRQSDGALSDAAFDALVLKSDHWSYRWLTTLGKLRSNAGQRFMFFTINGTAGTLSRGTMLDGSLTKNGTGDYTITFKYPSRQIPHVFAITGDETQYCQIISKSKTAIRVGVYNSSASAADGTVYLVAVTNNFGNKASRKHTTAAKASRGGCILMPFHLTAGVTGVLATLTHGTGNGAITLTSEVAGADGNDITLTLVDPGDTSDLSIDVTGTDIVVTLAYATGAITTTAAQLATALNEDEDVAELVTAAHGGTGANLMTALTETALSGGVTAVDATLTKGGEFLSITRNGNGDWTLTTRRRYRIAPMCLATAVYDSDTQPRYGIYSSSVSAIRLQCTQNVETYGLMFCFDERY